MSEFLNKDCMEDMVNFPDNHFQLAIVDVPYGIGAGKYKRGGTQYGQSKAKCKVYDLKDWDSASPSKKYWDELFRVSKNQIIWGANHFISKIPYDSSCWIVWDKMNGEGSGYADCELAWTSFKTAVRRINYRWSGMLQQDMKNKEVRIHPTQKPVQLYKWLLKNYAQSDFKILSTHVGSGSDLIAFEDFGCEYRGYEIDKDYYNAAKKRLKQHTDQLTIFQ